MKQWLFLLLLLVITLAVSVLGEEPQFLFTLTGHAGWINSVAFSPDGKLLASGSHDKTVKIWDMSSGQQIHTLTGHSDGVGSVVFSPDGKLLASGSWDNTIRLWDTRTWNEIRTLRGHTRHVFRVVFSPDGRWLASASDDGTIKLWEVGSGCEIHTLEGHRGGVTSVRFSPDGQVLASTSKDSTVKLWNVNTGEVMRSITACSNGVPYNYVLGVAFNPDGEFLAVGSMDSQSPVSLWEVDTGRKLRSFIGHSSFVTSVVFSSDGKLLASGSNDKTLRLWDVNTGQEVWSASGQWHVDDSVRFSPDGALLASGSQDGTVRIWDIRELTYATGEGSARPPEIMLGTEKWRFETGDAVASSPAIGSDGTIYVGSSDGYVYAINPNGTQKWRFQTGNTILSSPAIGYDGVLYIGSRDSRVYAINPDGTEKWQFLTGASVDSSPTIGLDGTIYIGSKDHNLYAINPDGTKRWQFSTSGQVDSSPTLGPDNTIYVGSCDGNLYAVNPDGNEKWKFLTGGVVFSSPAIGSDGTIYVGSYDENLYAINPDGSKKWECYIDGNLDSSPVIGPDGTIYIGSVRKNLYAINSDGTKKWQSELGCVFASPAIGSDGTVYVGSWDKNCYAINSDGTKKWEFATNGLIYSSPAISAEGTIYVGSSDDHLYAINIDPVGLADSPWPMFRHDTQHTGASFGTPSEIESFDESSGLDLKPHAPIYIEGNAGFTYANGVAGGSGTKADPYRIENWKISVTHYEHYSHHEHPCGIYIRDTDNYFTIRNCVVDDPTGENNGIALRNVENGTIEACVIQGTQAETPESIPGTISQGICILSAANVTIEGNRIEGFGFGINALESYRSWYPHDLTIRSNAIMAVGEGISLIDCSECQILQNDIFTHRWTPGSAYIGRGLGLSESSDCLVSRNVISECNEGIGLYGASGNTVSDNTVHGNSLAIKLCRNPMMGLYAEGNIIYGNSFSRNDRNACCGSYGSPGQCKVTDTAEPNSWDNGMTGNYWDDYEGEDRDGDGIGDTLYVIAAGRNVDRYPLMVPATDETDADGLADSPWPMFGHDARHTGRSPFKGPEHPTLKWSLEIGESDEATPVIGKDGTIYIGSHDRILNAVSPDGNLKWSFPTRSSILRSAVLATDGTIYVGDVDGNLYAINPDGTHKWVVETKGRIWSHPTIGRDGTLFLITRSGSTEAPGKLHAISPDGIEKWVFALGPGGEIYNSPAIGDDGTIYVTSEDGKLHAITYDGRERWTFDAGGRSTSSPAVANDDTIYFGSWDRGLCAVASDGTLKWRFTVENEIYSSPAIGSNGTVYILDTDQVLYALGSTGKLKWRFETNGMGAPVTIGADGTIYIAPGDHLLALDLHGNLKWRFTWGDIPEGWAGLQLDSSPVIGPDGVIYIAAMNGMLYAIGEASTEETIDLTGLANSPWPMYRHDLQHMGRSSNKGPDHPEVKWYFASGLYSEVISSPAIAADGTIYVGSTDHNLYAISPNGTERWYFTTGAEIVSSPAIASDSTIYVGSSDGNLYAIDPDGSEKWHFTTQGSLEASPAIGADGTIYIGSGDGNLYAISAYGYEKWRFIAEDAVHSSPALGVDGTIYVAPEHGHLYAISPNGREKWRFQAEGLVVFSAPAIAADDTIYYVSSEHGNLYAIDPDGSEKWQFTTRGSLEASPAIGMDGTIYVGSGDGNLYAINADGSEKWRFATGDDVDAAPAIGADGIVYIVSYDGNLYAINADGSEKWHLSIGEDLLESSPSIGGNGDIYVGCDDGKLYAIGEAGAIETVELEVVTTYTLKLDEEQYERVFRYGDDFYLVVVLRNDTSQDISVESSAIRVRIANEEGEGRGSATYDARETIDISPGEFRALKYRIHCSKEDATWIASGFTFVGKKLTATVTLGEQSKEYSFFIDEFGIPEWLRNVIFVEPPLSGDDIHQNIDPDKLTRRRLKNYYTDIAQRCNEIGFNCVAFGDYYKYGYLESHDPVLGIDHWFPASSSPFTYYNTPADYLVDITGSEQKARGLIEELVDILHDHGLKTRAYTDPNGLYSPDPAFWNPANPAYNGIVAHHDSDHLGWARFRNGEVQRLNYLESIVELPFGGSFPSPIRSLAVEICPSGPSKTGPANADAGFDPAVIAEDLDIDPKHDPSFHYQEVKQTLWLTQEYGFDGVCPDDTGRLIMAAGPADYADDPWTLAMHPELPSDSLYGVCECGYCTQLQEAAIADDDSFALDSYANMLKHMRWQTKYNNPEGFLMSGDYLVPSDVEWDSIVASEDISVSDQFNIWMPSFARWAYRTFNLGYRVLRTDLRRSLMLQPVPSFGRRDLLIGVLIATAWANKVHVDVNDPRDAKLFSRDEEEWDDADKLVYTYVRMRASLDHQYNTGQIAVPLFTEEEAQELLYHKKLADPVVNIEGEYEFVNAVPHGFPPCIISEEEPYTILYSLPGEHGERGRILHVMSNKVVSDCPNSSIEYDYTFNIRIPEGEEIERILLVSADLYNGKIDPDRDGRSTTQEEKDYISDITSRVGDTSEGSALWRRMGDHIRIKVPHVIAYSAVLIEFSEATLAEEASTDDEALAREYMPNFWQLACDIEKGNSVSEVCYYVERDGGKAKIEYSVVFEDEDHPNPVLDELYDLMRGSPVDIETFYVTVDLRSQEVERILFHFPYRPSCPSDPASMLDSFGQEGSGTWYGGQPYNVFLPVHYCEEFSGGQVAEEFDINDGHVDIYVATWNHLFSNSGAREPPYNCNEWRSFTYDTIELVNKSRGELEEERSLVGQPFAILATCPVNLTITDPDGLVVKKGSIQVPGATYVEEDVDFDGAPDDVVLIPDRKPGNYQIGVIPEYGALATDRYTLRVSAAGSTKILADNVSIRDIPKTPYVVRSSAQGLSHPVEQAIPTISRKGGLGVGAIIGIIVGALGLLGAGYFVFRFLRSRYYI